jgi:hypothetical protein
MSGLRVYTAITAITAELARCGIVEWKINEVEQYAYRGIDDVMEALAPLLAKHWLCVLPRVHERISCDAYHPTASPPTASPSRSRSTSSARAMARRTPSKPTARRSTAATRVRARR